MIYYNNYLSPLGKITLGSDGKYLIGLYINGQKKANTLYRTATQETLPIFTETAKWLNLYFCGKIPNYTPDLNLIGTDFQKSVWKKLLAIPYGKTVTYGEIAEQLAKEKGIPKMSAQAVGSAVGKNPVPIIVPCHRVIGANGNLIGYTGGIDKKIKLLSIENVDVSKFSLPKKNLQNTFFTENYPTLSVK